MRGRPGGTSFTGAAVMLLAAAVLGGCGSGEEDATTPAAGPPPTADGSTSTTGTGDAGARSGKQQGPTPEERAAFKRRRDRAAVTEAIEAVLEGSDPDVVCRRAITEEFIVTAYGDLSGCLNGRPPRTLARSTEISGLAVAGAEATAVAVPRAGLYDGLDLEVALVRDGNGWRVDELVADVPVGP